MAWTTALVLVLGIAAYGVAGDSFLTPLANYVKSHSDPDVPPQQDVNTPVEVFFNLSIKNIDAVDKDRNTVSLQAYVRPRWNSSITWNPTDFGGADWLTLPKKYFWTPVLQVVDNSIEMKDLSPQKCVLFNDGIIIINQLYRLDLMCDVSNVESGATCHSVVSVWGYSKDKVFISGIGDDTTDTMGYFPQSKFEITGFDTQIVGIDFKQKHFQIVNIKLDFKKKESAKQGPVNLYFEWH